MNGYLILAFAVFAEVIATSALASIEGLSRPVPLLLVVVGYVISFFLLSIVVKSIPIGVAYAIWSGMGIVLVAVVGMVFYQQRPDVAAIAGMLLIISGVVIMQLYSSMKAH